MALFGHTKLVVDQQDGPVPRPGSREAADRAAVRAAPQRHYRGPPAARGSARPQPSAGGRARRVQAHGDHRVRPPGGRGLRRGTRRRRQRGGIRVPGAAQAAGPAAALRPNPRFAGWSPYFRPPPYGCRFDLRPGLPDPALFPAALWRRQVAAAVTAEQSLYGDPAGKIRLRRAIAGWVARSRSVAAAEDTVVITCGAQHAIDLVTRVLLEPGDCVAVEDPGYVPAVRLFEALGAKVVGVPVDDQGLVVDLLPPSARIVYVTPSHQYPLGMTMSMPRRRALLRWAERHDAAVIEDDYDTEFRYVDRPLEPLQALDADGRVVYVGSFSKTFSPSVRLGFAVVPQPLAEPVAALRQLIDWHPPIVMQTALAGFIDDGLLDKHIRRSRRVYTERHHILTEALSGPLSDHLTARAPNAGLHVAAVLRGELDEKRVLQAAARHGIVTSGLRHCFYTSRRNRAWCSDSGPSAPPVCRWPCARWAAFSPPEPP